MMIAAVRRFCALGVMVGVCVPLGCSAPSEATPTVGRAEQAASALVDPVRLERAHRRLVQVSATLGREVPLAELLMLTLSGDGDEATRPAEYQATLVALAFYVNQWPLTLVAQQARDWPAAAPRRVTARGRHDHARHFLVSAAMAATVGSPLADAVAVYKELLDGRAGSGFSFPDVAANRAGQRFGRLAAESAVSAAALAARLRAPLTDADIMPATTGLPEGLSDQEFSRRYGAVGSVNYNRVIDDIDRRLSALALYR
jgi:hypothetical protein